MYLEETRIRNFTSCLKDRAFLDLFYRRMRYNNRDYPEQKARGYSFYSLCMGEVNFCRPDDSILVFQKLIDDSQFRHLILESLLLMRNALLSSCTELTWAGTMEMPFDPSSLRVSPETGYLYHPSPTTAPSAAAQRRRARKTNASSADTNGPTRLSEAVEKTASPYGPYSLLRSSLVLEHLAGSLEMDDTAATFNYKGTLHRVDLLPEEGVLR